MNRIKRTLTELLKTKSRLLAGLAILAVILLVYSAGKNQSPESYTEESASNESFSGGESFRSETSEFFRRKDDLISKRLEKINRTQYALEESIGKLNQKLVQMEGREKEAKELQEKKAKEEAKKESVKLEEAKKEVIEPVQNQLPMGYSEVGKPAYGPQLRPKRRRRKTSGPEIISFPVQKKELVTGVMLPASSYVKGRLLTGLRSPEGKLTPALIAIEYAFISPNNAKVDLMGCFALAKSQASLSTERVEMQVSKLSCVGPSGKMFERNINGFVVDDKDNSFAVQGEVHSNQGRVAGLSFMSSVVNGIGEIIKRKSQNIGGANPDTQGGADVVVQTGATGAASQVAQWYLKQANNLLPTISVKSGQEIWIVMNESVSIPNEFFKKAKRKERSNENSFLSTIGK